MMLSYSFKLEKEAQAIENAVAKALDKGARTIDICGVKEAYQEIKAPIAAKDKAATQKILQKYKILNTEEIANTIIQEL